MEMSRVSVHDGRHWAWSRSFLRSLLTILKLAADSLIQLLIRDHNTFQSHICG